MAQVCDEQDSVLPHAGERAAIRPFPNLFILPFFGSFMLEVAAAVFFPLIALTFLYLAGSLKDRLFPQLLFIAAAFIMLFIGAGAMLSFSTNAEQTGMVNSNESISYAAANETEVVISCDNGTMDWSQFPIITCNNPSATLSSEYHLKQVMLPVLKNETVNAVNVTNSAQVQSAGYYTTVLFVVTWLFWFFVLYVFLTLLYSFVKRALEARR